MIDAPETIAVSFKAEFSTSGRKARPNPALDAARASAGPPVSRAARMLALAYWVERKIEAGELRDLAHAAAVLSVTRARMSQIADLRLLPLAVQEQVLTPGYRGSERGLRSFARLDARANLDHADLVANAAAAPAVSILDRPTTP